MTKAQRQLIAFRKARGMSTKQFAEWIGRKFGRTVRRWESGDMPVPPELERLMALIDSLPQKSADAAIEMIDNMDRRK